MQIPALGVTACWVPAGRWVGAGALFGCRWSGSARKQFLDLKKKTQKTPKTNQKANKKAAVRLFLPLVSTKRGSGKGPGNLRGWVGRG